MLRTLTDIYLRDCFASETAPRLKELALRLATSPERLTRMFASRFGVPASQYLKRAQIIEAKRLLRTTSLPLNDIAYACGFGTRASFYRAFRRSVGTTPGNFRSSRK